MAERTVLSALAVERPAELFAIGTLALAPATRSLAHLLPALDRRLHVVAPSLELAENALTGHLPLEMFDGSLDALVPDLDLEGSTLDCFARNSQGAPHMAETRARCKPSSGAVDEIP
jgi:hypothetical protein